jgi:gliding motility-associated-like protein
MRRIIYKSILSIACVVFIQYACAQTCTGSLGDPVFNETFGAGTTQLEVGPPLPMGVTTLQYNSMPCAENDAAYGFPTYMFGCHAGTWQNLNHDHTGDPYGYFMLINGPNYPEVVYSQKVSGSTLCPNTTYQFAAWIMNAVVYSPGTANFVLPNLTFTITTASGQVLKTITIGDIPETVTPEWNQYGTFFTSPSDGSDVYINLTDNQTEQGYGNDFAVDDITFSPCGPLISTGFNTLNNQQNQNLCGGDTATFTMVASQQGYNNPVYQWQQNLNDGNGWADIPGANTTTLTKTLNGGPTGTYEYRIGVLDAGTTSTSCRIYSQPLNIYITPFPTPIPPQTTVCEGQPIQLSVNQADTYQWTGPNGFTSNEEYPVVTAAAQAANSGKYTVTATSLGCPSTSSTTVEVYPKVAGVISNDTTICEGTSAVLSVAQSQGETNISWTPTTGLDNYSAATVNASPSQTTTYTATLSNGCNSITAEVTVKVLQKPVASAGPAKTITQGESVKLEGTVKGDSVTYYWTPAAYLDNPNSLTPMASPVENTTYTLHAQNNYNCGGDTSNVFIRVYQKLTIPNTFTPNNDGVNDYWDIKNLNTYPECSVLVFDRYGRQVYQSNGYNKSWDGTYDSSKLPTGTYYYIIDLKNDTPKISGWVLIVH